MADSNGEHARTVETGIAATKTIDAVCWAPDGRSIYLAVSDAGDNTRARESQLWRVPMDGGAPHDTGLSGTSIGRIDLNRDGSRLAYSAGQLARYELWALDNLDTTWKTRPSKRGCDDAWIIGARRQHLAAPSASPAGRGA